MTSQNARLIAYLKTHESISVAEAPAAVGIGCLTKRVSECRRAGHPIKDYTVEQESPWGGKARFKRYYLDMTER